MKHLIIEANCMYDFEKKNNINVPVCCKHSAGSISINCLGYQEEKRQMCPYLVFGTAKSTLVLTDEEGEAINSVSFWDDLKLSSEEWKMRERAWIRKSNDILQEMSNNNESHNNSE